MSSIDLRRKVVELLSTHQGTKFRARDIATWLHETYPEAATAKMLRSERLSSTAQLLNQLVAEIGANRPKWERQLPQLRTTEGVRPRLYYWSEQTEEQEVAEAESPDVVQTPVAGQESLPTQMREADLYPLVIEFIETEYPAQGFRIDEKRSSNLQRAGANKWLFPDIVVMESLTKDMQSEVVTAIRESGDRQIRLWSVEVKLLLNRSNAREAYFQAVSNSSWANLGYLAAANIEGVDTLKELRILFWHAWDRTHSTRCG